MVSPYGARPPILTLKYCRDFKTILRAITNAPWYVPNRVLHTDLMITTIREEITRHSTAHINKLRQHTNPLIPTILEEKELKRLKRHTPADLTHRF